jgi:hypothetical protein
VQQEPSNSYGAWLGWLVVAGIAFVAIKSCSANSPTTQSLVSNTNSGLNVATAAPAAPPNIQLPEVDENSVSRAARHLRLALDAEGFPGAMVYSQNCFASLSHSFSWAKLDQCEAFDALAQIAISQSGQFGTEATYFAKDAVDQRFTQVASDRQADPSSAQTHLSALANAALTRIADLQTADPDVEGLTAKESSDQTSGNDSTASDNASETSNPSAEASAPDGSYDAPTYSYVAPATSGSYSPTPSCSESGSCYGDISNVTGLPKTTYVHGYFRKNGTYVRGYYRSHR